MIASFTEAPSASTDIGRRLRPRASNQSQRGAVDCNEAAKPGEYEVRNYDRSKRWRDTSVERVEEGGDDVRTEEGWMERSMCEDLEISIKNCDAIRYLNVSLSDQSLEVVVAHTVHEVRFDTRHRNRFLCSECYQYAHVPR